MSHETQIEVEGVRTFVMGAEYLIAIALRVGRPKDHARIVQFLDLKVADMEKLKSILNRYGLESKWDRFQRMFLRTGDEQAGNS